MIEVLIIVFIMTAILVKNYLFQQETYYQITHNSLFSTYFDLGRRGEYYTYRKLKSYEKNGAKFLFNCYLPKDSGETTEIDVLMINQNGLFAFESKNYSGWIFGNESSKNWTQVLPQGRIRILKPRVN